jgi:iron uptake system component EfeO
MDEAQPRRRPRWASRLLSIHHRQGAAVFQSVDCVGGANMGMHTASPRFQVQSASARSIVLMSAAFLAVLCGHTTAAAAAAVGQRGSPVDSAAERFKPYILEQITKCEAAVKLLRDRIAAKDLPGAQQAWLAARGGWESSEVVTSEYFPDLDRAIDAWPDAQKGFHAIEAKLFGAHSLDALPAADELVANVRELERRLRTTSLTAQGLLNGTARLVYEIGEDKAGGGESPFSGNSVAEIGNNVDAVKAVYQAVYAPALARREGAFSKTLAGDLTRLQALVAVRDLQQLDEVQLRELSETVTSDFVGVSQRTGLDKPGLEN